MARVIYPGRADHPQAEIVGKQMSGGSSLICFDLKGGKRSAFAFENALRTILISSVITARDPSPRRSGNLPFAPALCSGLRREWRTRCQGTAPHERERRDFDDFAFKHPAHALDVDHRSFGRDGTTPDDGSLQRLASRSPSVVADESRARAGPAAPDRRAATDRAGERAQRAIDLAVRRGRGRGRRTVRGDPRQHRLPSRTGC